ncbi:hypothetical protein PTTG_06548 [Puccinia triticina 1-1 BBBD Race 1]|uniref:Uncharacterized protein n=1 Tax=Puccinia triticina (isolate 1-1 / race 1 (BBBD)) TaxID=630390 RepID=A0A180GD98_PUCT1|nr:hypothetical protein PTTG_06548 [Puccinia triticina 1-1 BBBD Race 1]
MSQPHSGGHIGWEQLKSNYDPLGTNQASPPSPHAGQNIQNNPARLAGVNPNVGPNHGNNPAVYHGIGHPIGDNHAGLPAAGQSTSEFINPNQSLKNPVNPPRPSQIGPVRTPALSRIAPSPSPYPMSPLPGGNHQLWSPSPTRSDPRNSSQSSQLSTTESQVPSHEDLQVMQDALQAIEGTFSLSNELIQRAQPLFQMTPEAQNIAVLLLALQNGSTARQPSLIAPITISDPSPVVTFNDPMKNFVRETAREVLLEENIQSYGSRAAMRLRVADTPVKRVRSTIDKRSGSEEFRAVHLPPNYDQGDALDKLVADTVKSEKASLAILLKTGLTREGPLAKVPNLYSLIANVYSSFHPLFKKLDDQQIHLQISKGAKIRLFYMRFMANYNRIKQRNKQISFWDDMDKDLARLRKKSTAYGVAYSQLIFNLDKQTWDGEKAVHNIPPKKQQPPSKEEIEQQVAIINAQRSEQVNID